MADPDTCSTPSSASWRRDLLWLTIVFAGLFFFRNGSHPLRNPDEGRYAEIAREMVETGDWITPRLNGVNYFEKPPLVYWTNALALKVFGPEAWAMRATPALFAVLGVLLTYAAARRMHGRIAGIASAVVLGTALLYCVMSNVLVLDMPVSVLMSATLFCFILGIRAPAPGSPLEEGGPAGSGRRWFFYGLYAAAALATLAKGLIGFLVTGAVMFLWLLVFNQWRRLRPLYLPSGILIFLAIAAPWHVLVALRNQTWAHRYFVYEHFERFLTPAADRPGPWWYFVPIVAVGIFPWTGFLWAATRNALAGGWKRRAENVDSWFLATWIGFIFVFFSVSHSKLPPYILPVFPPLAVLIGAWISRVHAERDRNAVRGGLRVFSFATGVLVIVLGLLVVRHEIAGLSDQDAGTLQPAVIVLVTLLLAGGIMAPRLSRVRGARLGLLLTATTAALFFVGLKCAPLGGVIKPGTMELALVVKEQARPGDRVLHYHNFFHDFTFYAGRIVDVVSFKGELELDEDAAARASGRFIDEPTFRRQWSEPCRMFVVARKRDVDPRADGRPTLFSDPAFRYHLLAETQDHYLFSNQP